MRRALCIAATALVATGVPAAQESLRPVFEVASITRNASGRDGQQLGARPGGRLLVRNVSGRDLVASAWGLRLPDQIVGSPGWFESERYDIDAKAATEADYPGLMLMLRTLLAERFALKARVESRTVAAYALRIDKAPTLTPARADDCDPPPKGYCGGFQTRPGMITGRSVTLAQLAGLLMGRTGRPVIDETAIQGRYDFQLTWTPDVAPAGSTPDGLAPTAVPDAPSIFTALREQLGLRLENTKGPMDVLVIDSVQRPTEN